MKRILVNTLSAAAVMFATAATPMTTLAAVSTYQVPFSGGSAYVIGIGGKDCLPGSGNWGQNGNWNQNGNWGTRPVLPEVVPPDIIFPTPELPGPILPDQPDNMLPDQPGDMIPDQPENPGVTPEVPDDETPDKPEQEEGQDAYTNAVVALVNAERAKAGLSPLTVDTRVAEAAQLRAQEIKKTFSHTRPDGSSFSTALSQAGVSYRGTGENIAYGQNSPEAVMQGWMNSSGHRANILNKDYTSIGVGHYKDASGTDYWTQLFTY